MPLQWLVPMAAVGALALLVPLLLHLLSRRPPDVVSFPSLQLLRRAALRPTQRARLTDIPLLVVRMAVLGAAVLALMQPAWQHREAGVAASPSVLVLRDTTALPLEESATVDERRGLGSMDSTGTHTDVRLLAPAQLRDGLHAAVAWLSTRPAPRVLEVHSRFPLWAIDSADVQALPADITLRLIVPPPASRSAQFPARESAYSTGSTLPWPPDDSAAAWWNVMALWQLASAQQLAIPWWFREPLGTSGNVVPLFFNAQGETAVAVERASGALTLRSASADTNRSTRREPAPAAAAAALSLHDAMQPQLRLAAFAAPVPRDSLYHDAGTLMAWTSRPAGAAIGVNQSRDVHVQDTLARWLWGLTLALLLLEQLMRRRIRS